MIVRADNAYYGRPVIAAARRGGARFSVTARKDRAVTKATAAIPDLAWVQIRYPRAIFDEELRQWVSDAEVAEIPFTAFISTGKTGRDDARLIVRRVRDANPIRRCRCSPRRLITAATPSSGKLLPTSKAAR